MNLPRSLPVAPSPPPAAMPLGPSRVAPGRGVDTSFHVRVAVHAASRGNQSCKTANANRACSGLRDSGLHDSGTKRGWVSLGHHQRVPPRSGPSFVANCTHARHTSRWRTATSFQTQIKTQRNPSNPCLKPGGSPRDEFQMASISSSQMEQNFDSVSGSSLRIADDQIVPGGVALTPNQKQTLDRFWCQHGVVSKAHRLLLIKTAAKKGLFRSPDRLVAKMMNLEDTTWRAVGITNLDVGKVVGRYPKSLYFDDDFLVERLRLLRDLLPGADLKKLLERNPQVLAMDMTHTLPAKMREVRNFPVEHAPPS
jgi:hypothetical protein